MTILQLYQREPYPNICRLYINMNQHCWLQNINIFSYLSDKSPIERQVAIKFTRFLQISPSSLLNHINLFLSDNSGKKLLFILEKKVFLAKEYLLHFINKCSSSSTASQLHCLHILFSTAVFGIVHLPLSISSLCALIRKRIYID